MTAAYLITIGSELLIPGHEDAHGAYIKIRLLEMGIQVRGISVVGDEEESLQAIIESARGLADLIILTGGLGPTEDDITKKVVARSLGKRLRYDERVKAKLEEFFVRRNRTMPENCLRQALVPVGGRVIANEVGTAPGVVIDEKQKVYILLPGPPREMKPMFENEVIPFLYARFHKTGLEMRHLRLAGIPESTLDEKIAPIYTRYPDVRTTILSRPGDIQLILTGAADSGTIRQMNRLVEEIMGCIGEYVYSTEGRSLEEELGMMFSRKKFTLSLAESCTGGLLGKRITDIAGSSGFFLGGVICYSNESKIVQVGVPEELLQRHGAVSRAVAGALAAAVQRRMGSTASMSITGIAGPSGGTQTKPVGTVYIGSALKDQVNVKKCLFHGDREAIRYQSTQMAMRMLWRMLVAG